MQCSCRFRLASSRSSITTLCPTTQQYCSRGFEQLYSILITHFIRLILLFIIFIRWADKQSRRQKIYE